MKPIGFIVLIAALAIALGIAIGLLMNNPDHPTAEPRPPVEIEGEVGGIDLGAMERFTPGARYGFSRGG